MEKSILIIADDFTGANDTGVQLRRRGYRTRVMFPGGKIKPEAGEAVVIDTESRILDGDQASGIVKKAAGSVEFHDYRYVIKKVDSTLRGNISREIQALDQAYQPELIVFAPALPDLGRTTVNGIQRLNGVEICRTELASDPKNPVRQDSLPELLKERYEEPVGLLPIETVRSGEISMEGARLWACDAETNGDLLRIIEAAEKTGKRILYAGTAGIVDNLMKREAESPPALCVAASISSVTNAQMRYCEKAGIRLVKLPVHEILSRPELADSYVREVIDSLKSGQDTAFLTNTSYDRNELPASREAGEAAGMELSELGDYLRAQMGRYTRQILEACQVSGIFVTGGDTALGVMKSLEAEGAEICSEILVGIPMVRIQGGPFDGLKMVTKAGAFGGEDAAAFAMRKLKDAEQRAGARMEK